MMLPDTFNQLKSGYITFEYTMFVNRGVKYNKKELTTLMTELIDKIYEQFFNTPIEFEVIKNRVDLKSKRELMNWNPDEYFPGDETSVNEKL